MLDLSQAGAIGSMGSLESGDKGISNLEEASKKKVTSSESVMPLLTMTYYEQYFSVSTEDIVQRLRLALLPFLKSESSNSISFKENPDFYGPFWIATTVILFMAGTANVTRFLSSVSSNADFELVSLAATYVYGCLFLVPFIIRRIVTGIPGCFDGSGAGDHISYSQLMCVYGYSLIWLIPLTLISLSNSHLVQWITCIIGLSMSVLFLGKQLYSDFAGSNSRSRWAIIGVSFMAQVLLFFMYKLYFVS
eukprot:GDKJ01050553.1.p1 GENE.GDKJ01050553.1~~GDKJ01050553.1.p1  ORF type:complete len:249 (-),score=38.14 GDKJ01050553.1:147-893(-)